LISAATESNLVLFAYDGRHRCVKRIEIQNGIGRTTFMVWGHEPSQGWGLLEERGANGELIARHVHGPSVDDLVLSELGGAVYYYHHDHLNSTIAVTDESGNVVEQYRYDAYGQPYFYGPDGTRRAKSAFGTRFLFTGREWLASLGLYDYRHRAYSPSLGRFLQMDPIGFGAGDVNVYRYSVNNPTGLIDPTGKNPSAVLPGLWAGALTEPTPLGEVAAVAATIGIGGYLILDWLMSKSEPQKCEDIEGSKPPFEGKPGSTVRGDKQTRRYGEDGYPQTDVDTGHNHGAGDPHSHDWGRPLGGGRPTHENRGPARPLRPGDPPLPRNAP
jgi:RHS repeat-associated protein